MSGAWMGGRSNACHIQIDSTPNVFERLTPAGLCLQCMQLCSRQWRLQVRRCNYCRLHDDFHLQRGTKVCRKLSNKWRNKFIFKLQSAFWEPALCQLYMYLLFIVPAERFRAHNLVAVCRRENCKFFFGGGEFPLLQQDAWNKDCYFPTETVLNYFCHDATARRS